jgi:L-amino acid N-acyltransferase YncA
VIRYAQAGDLGAILDIYNDAILNTTSVYYYNPRTIEDRLYWYEKKVKDGFPVLVFEENNHIIGFATFGPFRTRPAYKYTVEHSVYVHKFHRGKGVATKLMIDLIKIASERGYATIKGVGYKFGKWLDVTFYQYELRGPATPKEE